MTDRRVTDEDREETVGQKMLSSGLPRKLFLLTLVWWEEGVSETTEGPRNPISG